MIPRPTSFGANLLLRFVLVVAVAQFATWFLISRFHFAQARSLINAELQRAAYAFTRVVEDRNKLLTVAANAAARDYPTKRLFSIDDSATLASALTNIRIFSDAAIVSALSLEGRLLASTSPSVASGDLYAGLVARAEADPGPNPSATGYGYLDGQLHSFVVAPVRAPDIIGWLVIGFRIDHDFAQSLREQTGIELTFFDHAGRLLATTLAEPIAAALAAALPHLRAAPEGIDVQLGRETALVALRALDAGNQESATLALQYSLDEKLRPARESERWLLGVALGSLVLAGAISRAFALRLTRPILELVGHTRRIASGDYSIRNRSYRIDELSRLSEAFDQMSRGLTERDHVRDLLDKNVSPEVAAQLVRDGAALGGEEREVTVLFVDLRGFTTMSEKFSPHDLLTLLNRYLDRMSAEIERQGGVIDKFIGDAIMALFGAPIAQSDAADRALAAAVAMERALVILNSEFAAEAARLAPRSAGEVAPSAPNRLALGIGINTARVVAGNIGSHRRLNYSVIGDGVNVAARLEALTRTPEYDASIITSAATVAAIRDGTLFSIRPLGSVQVKGRAEAVKIFAVASGSGPTRPGFAATAPQIIAPS